MPLVTSSVIKIILISNIFVISAAASAVILALLLISPVLSKRYSASWRYFVWIIIAVRLVIPFRFEFPNPPVKLPAPPNRTFVMGTTAIPSDAADEGYTEIDSGEENSVGYIPVITADKLVFIIWAAIASLIMAFHIVRYIIFKQKIKHFCVQKNIYEGIPVVICSKIEGPMMTGFFKPVILLPEADYTENELNAVLAHELTHYKRRDIWCKLLFAVANAMHWFNPIIYVMVRYAVRDMEYSCDEIVVKEKDMEFRKEYSRVILKSMGRRTRGGIQDE